MPYLADDPLDYKKQGHIYFKIKWHEKLKLEVALILLFWPLYTRMVSDLPNILFGNVKYGPRYFKIAWREELKLEVKLPQFWHIKKIGGYFTIILSLFLLFYFSSSLSTSLSLSLPFRYLNLDELSIFDHFFMIINLYQICCIPGSFNNSI